MFNAKRTLTTLTVATLSMLAAHTADAATLQVCSTCPYTTIQDAVTAAASGDTIQIAPGVYFESVQITGARTLILRPSSGRVTIDASGFDRALDITDPGANVVLQEMDLIKADGYAGLINRGRATLVTVRVVGNTGDFGGILNTGSLLTFQNTVIGGNVATALGSAGGLNNQAWADLWFTTVIGNQGHEGGGFKSSGNSRVDVFYSSISSNLAATMGGGYVSSSPLASVTIHPSSTFSGNTANFCNTYYDVNKTPWCVN